MPVAEFSPLKLAAVRDTMVALGWSRAHVNGQVAGVKMGSRWGWPESRSRPRLEIGHWCRTSFVGRGFVTEVVRALTAVAFERRGTHRVEIRLDDRNDRRWRAAERCGFTLEGTLWHDERAPDGSLGDTRVDAVLRGK